MLYFLVVVFLIVKQEMDKMFALSLLAAAVSALLIYACRSDKEKKRQIANRKNDYNANDQVHL